MNLTTKELTAIEEQLGQEQLLIQKFKMYAQMTQDQQLRSSCEQIAAKHQIHKDKLLNLLRVSGVETLHVKAG